MNIMFLLKFLDMGGVEIVTATLANKFVSEGHRVCIFSFFEPSSSMRERIDDRILIYQLRKFAVTEENVQAMRAVMLEEKVQIVINQWGLPVVPIKVACKAASGLGIKIITVYHNMPNANGRVQTVDIKLSKTNNPIKRGVLKLERKAFEIVTGRTMRYNYDHSDRYMVLSPSFIDIFAKFANIRDKSKLIVQTNPVTISDESYTYEPEKKEKELLYVGRIDSQQKRVERVIEVWEMLYASHPDWRLTIVGDGESKENMVRLAKEKNLPRISFEGFQNPKKYYERASLLMLTSDYEGYGLVIVEGMHFGVVPVVYGSYPAVYDIIGDGLSGRIVQPVNGEYNKEYMVKALASYMDDKVLLYKTAKAAIERSKNFSVEEISKQWNSLFVKICKIGGVNLSDELCSILSLYAPYALKLLPFEYHRELKEKELIYVGRIDLFQKRVERVIETWTLLEDKHPDWRLTIVGDGPERQNVEQLAKDKGLKRISFEGFQSPVDYYKRASLLILTSEFEGFPLVLAEAMSFGVVPTVYDSYPAVHDIICNGENGMIVEPVGGNFSAESMANCLSELMADDDKREAMALSAIKTAKEDYSIDAIYAQWMEVFNEIIKH